MSYIQAIFLGAVQGITEFLPISSSGHLVVFQKIFRFSEPPIAFDVLVHLGTVFALFLFFRKEIRKIFINLFGEIKEGRRGSSANFFIFLGVGTIPIIIVGLFLQSKIDFIFGSLFLVGVSFLVTSVILFLTKVIKKKQRPITQARNRDALFIGLFQALAIMPGISRSGSTISAGLFKGIKKEDAFNFSFFLGIIAILGASVIQIPEIASFHKIEFLNGFLGFFVAAVSGFFALKILKPIVIKGKFHYFGIYCLILGIACLALSLF